MLARTQINLREKGDKIKYSEQLPRLCRAHAISRMSGVREGGSTFRKVYPFDSAA